jgi:ATP-dependent helicase HrpA
MVLEAQKHGCVREAMIITSALSIQDPRERPMDKQQASDENTASTTKSPISSLS